MGPKRICVQCKYLVYLVYRGTTGVGYTCGASPYLDENGEPVAGIDPAVAFRPCSEINKHGDCPEFVAKADELPRPDECRVSMIRRPPNLSPGIYLAYVFISDPTDYENQGDASWLHVLPQRVDLVPGFVVGSQLARQVRQKGQSHGK